MRMKKISKIIIKSAGIVAITGAIVASNLLINKFSGILKPFFGFTERGTTPVDYEGVDPFYYKKECTKKELNAKLTALGEKVAEEGIIVLENGNIPFSTKNELALFSKSSVDFVFGGTGSGVATGNINLKDSLEKNGYKVNEKLWNFYKKSSNKRGIGSINYGDSDDFSINEVPLSAIKKNNDVLSSLNQSNIGVFVLSRTGGEGNDIARGMSDYVDTSKDLNKGLHPDAEKDKYRSYLEPDSIELEIMQFINDNFDDFILIVNCNNAMELGFVEKFDNLSTIVQIPATGASGLNKLGEILSGKVIASGKLADTFVYDSFAIPSSQNIGDFEYLLEGEKIKNITKSKGFDGLYYMNYDESIYVGYRYFETRYADKYLNKSSNANADNWKYEENVKYPFGYGQSLVKFSYSNFTLQEHEDVLNISVKIVNESKNPAKTPVELYFSAPFGDFEKQHGIEIPSIELLDFGKTKTLKSGESQVVNFNITKEQLLKYSEQDSQYYLPGGEYYFTVGFDAHAAINNVLRKIGVSEELVKSPSEEIAGNETLVNKIFIDQDLNNYKDLACNQFEFANAKIYENHTYLSRQDWFGTYPKIDGEISNIRSIHSERTLTAPNGSIGSFEFTKEISKDSKILQDVVNFETLAPENYGEGEVKWGQESNLEAIDLRGHDISDPRYDEVVSKMTLSEAENMFAYAGYETASAKRIQKPRTFDVDGPAGFNTISGHSAIGFSYPCSLIIAQTWNKDLMNEIGQGFGQESLEYSVQGWYGPTANIHRSPFGGRNFEYFSEDPVLTGEAAKQEIAGAAKYGLFVYLKHFALNDQETHREKENGVCIFANEQTIREIYLKAFQKAIVNNKVEVTYYEIERGFDGEIVKNNGEIMFTKKTSSINACTGIMSSFSRIGGVWAGACYPLINSVLTNEWGFKGCILTDYYHFWFMNKSQSLHGGGNLILDPQGNYFSINKKDMKSQVLLHEGMKNVLYAVVNSNAMNGFVHGVKEIPSFGNYIYVQIGVNLLFAAGGIALISSLVIQIVKKKEKKNG